jgi:hypothetical protein
MSVSILVGHDEPDVADLFFGQRSSPGDPPGPISHAF